MVKFVKVLKNDLTQVYQKPVENAFTVDNELSVWNVDRVNYEGETMEIICVKA